MARGMEGGGKLMDWTRVADWSATALTLIGLGARQQYLKGKNAEQFAELARKVEDLKDRAERHDARLSAGGEAFVRISEQLKALNATVEAGFTRVENQASTTNNILIHHISDGAKER